ncbi:MAG: aminomethyl-transferring glycine dehydrogenase [Bacteroidetes bacterium]|nr:aminomethyl-transferring glycine dehydrogenase [Bacteroidota bacterium]
MIWQNEFLYRHIGPREDQQREMLAELGVQSFDELLAQAIPSHLRSTQPIEFPLPRTEHEVLEYLRSVSKKNTLKKSYLGQGYYNTYLPPVLQRNILENPAWYTSYTPYQAEISQGRLEALLIFQTMVCDMTGMEVANASLLDEGTAAAEAMLMAFNLSKKDSSRRNKFFLSSQCFHQTIEVVLSRAIPHNIELVVGNPDHTSFDSTFFGALLQYPNENGSIVDYREFINKVHAVGAIAIVATDLLACALLVPPGEMGADIVVGSAQRFGVPLGYGGPHAGFFATRTEYIRFLPGRLIGVSIDADGNPAYRMALQTREQHIRREKATSNICTAQALLAIIAGMYAVYHGPEGIRHIAERVHALTQYFDDTVQSLGYRQLNTSYFDTLRIAFQSRMEAEDCLQKACETGYNLRLIEDRYIGISFDETTSVSDIHALLQLFANIRGKVYTFESTFDEKVPRGLRFPRELVRTSPYLTHPTFHLYRSETAFIRYLKRLEEKDISLTTSMIPLGSCTMKLNAAVEMIPITWPEFSGIHPFVPPEQAQGYEELISALGKALCSLTGFADITFQPNSGAQGEFAGLSIIRAYHHDRNESQRNIVLIPSSAHGTNPASAVMAGFSVVVVQCDVHGNIDFEDLKKKAEQYRHVLAGLMITYPSTHGVYEEHIKDICAIIHENGGLVYMDGANLNALVGFVRPRDLGADVCHINLHKTFAIPHGGGGPGMGPVCVAEELVQYLPRHTVTKKGGPKSIPAVSSSPYGSANILPISYAYILLLGLEGLMHATRCAILNANYLKTRLEKYYPILYTGPNNRVAHEFIVNLKPFKETAGIEAEDVAKRLMDFGFHAPTVSFPVPGTLMIEPTESEPKEELDRFVEAMITIREEIKAIEEGKYPRIDNPLKNAPHTAAHVLSEQWNHSYSRTVAAFPLPYLRMKKYWTPVARVNNTYGDRNIVCTLPRPKG